VVDQGLGQAAKLHRGAHLRRRLSGEDPLHAPALVQLEGDVFVGPVEQDVALQQLTPRWHFCRRRRIVEGHGGEGRGGRGNAVPDDEPGEQAGGDNQRHAESDQPKWTESHHPRGGGFKRRDGGRLHVHG